MLRGRDHYHYFLTAPNLQLEIAVACTLHEYLLLPILIQTPIPMYCQSTPPLSPLPHCYLQWDAHLHLYILWYEYHNYFHCSKQSFHFGTYHVDISLLQHNTDCMRNSHSCCCYRVGCPSHIHCNLNYTQLDVFQLQIQSCSTELKLRLDIIMTVFNLLWSF